MDDRVADGSGLRRHGPRFFLAAIFFVGSAAALLGDGGYLAARQLEGKVARQQGEIELREAEVEALRGRIESLERDAAAKERIAREELGYAGRDEVIFLLPRDPQP